MSRYASLGAALLAALPVVRPVAAQEALSVRWKLADFLLRGDSASGVEVLAVPSVMTHQGMSVSIAPHGLVFDPVTVRQWTALMRRVADSVDLVVHSTTGVLFPVLPPTVGRESLLIGYGPADDKGNRLFVGLFPKDSAARGWRAGGSLPEVMSLLDALDRVASRGPRFGTQGSAGDQAIHGTTGDTVLACAEVERCIEFARLDQRPAVISLPRNEGRGPSWVGSGRVWVSFIVDTMGHPEMRSAQIVFSDGPQFTAAAKSWLRQMVFKPGSVLGHPVRVRVLVPFRFRGF